MNLLPRADEAIIPIEKFTKYALNPNANKDKAIAFDLALGYNLSNVDELIEQVRKNLWNFPVVEKGNIGYGIRYEIEMDIIGANGKTAKVLTGWIDDSVNGEMRLTSIYINLYQ